MGIQDNFAKTSRANPTYSRFTQFSGAIGGVGMIVLAVVVLIKSSVGVGLFLMFFGILGIVTSVMYARGRRQSAERGSV